MSFLDNLENSLKSLERNDERDTATERNRRESERAQALAAAPYAEELKRGAFTAALLEHATRIGFGKRMKVNIVWIGNVLRLEARERRLELRPTPDGVVAVFAKSGRETSSEPVDFASDPEQLAVRWLEVE